MTYRFHLTLRFKGRALLSFGVEFSTHTTDSHESA